MGVGAPGENMVLVVVRGVVRGGSVFSRTLCRLTDSPEDTEYDYEYLSESQLEKITAGFLDFSGVDLAHVQKSGSEADLLLAESTKKDRLHWAQMVKACEQNAVLGVEQL